MSSPSLTTAVALGPGIDENFVLRAIAAEPPPDRQLKGARSAARIRPPARRSADVDRRTKIRRTTNEGQRPLRPVACMQVPGSRRRGVARQYLHVTSLLMDTVGRRRASRGPRLS